MSSLIVIGSSSRGNAYALLTSSGTLLIEAGCPLRNVRNLIRMEFVRGAIVSHRHMDHAKYVSDYALRFPVAAPKDVIDHYGLGPTAILLKDNTPQYVGGFFILPILVPHSDSDGRPCPCFAYLIQHQETGPVLFVTDTFNLPVIIPGIRHFIIEANYDDAILDAMVRSGHTRPAQKERIILSHMSLDNCIATLDQCGVKKARSITLVHLSRDHSQGTMFRERVLTSFGIPTFIARPSAVINLS